MINNPLKFLVLVIFQFILIPNYGYAQCGVIPGLISQPGGPNLETNINAGATTFDPGWSSYGWEWKVNNSVVSTDSILQAMGYFLPEGFSEVCLAVSATNLSTGDSCTREICNIFQSTGGNVYSEIVVSVNGMDVTAGGFDYGGTPISPIAANIDWGDGSSTLGGGGVHTYAVAGDYLICHNAYSGISGFTSCRKVSVGNGGGNTQVTLSNDVITDCYPFTVNGTGTNPPFTNGVAEIQGHASFPPIQNITNNANIQFPYDTLYPVVPGQAIIRIAADDPIHNWQIDDFVPVFFDVCAVVPDTIKGYVFDDMDANGVRNPGEPGIPNVQVGLKSPSLQYLNYYALTDSNGFYSLLAPNANFLIEISTPSSGVTFPANGSYTLDGAVNNTFPLCDFGVSNINTVISGNIFLDFNQNNIYDPASEVLYNYATIKAENITNGLAYYEVSNNNGSYIFNLTTGNYKITATGSQLDSAITNPDTIFINSTGGTFAQQDFGLYSPVTGNLGVRIPGSGEARPGFDYQSVIYIENTGFDTISGVLTFAFDSLLTATSANPGSGIIDNINHTVTWSTGLMPAVSSLTFKVDFTIPVSTPLGSALNFQAQAITDPGYSDNDPANNYDDFSEVVTGSFDPNDKNVDPAGIGMQNNVLHSDRLHYRIRFQNTGTASAINVFVLDEMDPQLDLNTFLMERSSHNYDLVTNGNLFTWSFLNILLPDSNTNEPASHGYIEYSIKAIQGLPDGTEIENTAAIYFDFNAPVITNTTLNTLQTTLVSVEEIVAQENLSLYPVPVRDELTITCGIKLVGEVTVELLDLQGRMIKSIYDEPHQGELRVVANVSELSAGVYVIRVSNSTQVMRKMFVKQ